MLNDPESGSQQGQGGPPAGGVPGGPAGGAAGFGGGPISIQVTEEEKEIIDRVRFYASHAAYIIHNTVRHVAPYSKG